MCVRSLKLLAFSFLIGIAGFGAPTPQEFESQLDLIQERMLRLGDERQAVNVGSLQYQTLEKNLGVLRGLFTKTREELTELQASNDTEVKETLSRTVESGIEKMNTILEEEY